MAWSNILAGDYTLFARIVGISGVSYDSPSTPFTARLPAATANLVQIDTDTRGNWLQRFGRSGFVIPGLATNLSPNISYSAEGAIYVWMEFTDDSSALQRILEPQRFWTVIYDIDFDLNASVVSQDGLTRQVAFYFCDSGDIQRRQVFRVLEKVTGAVLHEQTLEHFSAGVYLVYELRGEVLINIQPLDAWEPVLGGVFLGPAISEAELWKLRTLPATTSWNDDPDGDGRVNLLEYVWGTNPFLTDPPIHPEVRIQNDELVVRTEMSAPGGGIVFRLESSNDLKEWASVSVTGSFQDGALEFRIPRNGKPETYYRLNVELTGSESP
jgi:hypothetical protein